MSSIIKSPSKLAAPALQKSKRSLVSNISLLGLNRNGASRVLSKMPGYKVQKYLQNTYRLESYNPFNYDVVDKILINVMENTLTIKKYHPQICMQLCQGMTTELIDKICYENYDRYKIVVIITIIQKLGQTVLTKFGKLCDKERDTYSTHTIDTPEFIAVGLVVGMYYD